MLTKGNIQIAGSVKLLISFVISKFIINFTAFPDWSSLLKRYIFFTSLCIFSLLRAQSGSTLRGTILSPQSGNPITTAVVAVTETNSKTYTDENGRYYLEFPGSGSYTLVISASGYSSVRTTITINGAVERNFELETVSIHGRKYVIHGSAKIQDNSRRTLKIDDINEVPASYGDPLAALQNIPGVALYEEQGHYYFSGWGGISGLLTMRGTNPFHNRYYIDGIPMQYAQHFQLGHSVISSGFISEIDTYLSSYPSRYSGGIGGIIDFRSRDDIQKFESSVYLDLMNTSATVAMPINEKQLVDGQMREIRKGYVIVSGRISYLVASMPLIYRLNYKIADWSGNAEGWPKELNFVVDFMNYQSKFKYYLNTENSITLTSIGALDYLNVIKGTDSSTSTDEDGKETTESYTNRDKMHNWFNTLAMTHTYGTGKFSNRCSLFATLPGYYDEHIYTIWSDPIVNDRVEEFIDKHLVIKKEITPYAYGISDTLEYNWLDGAAQSILKTDYTLHNFKIKSNEYDINTDAINDFTENYDWVADTDNSYAADYDECLKSNIKNITFDRNYINHSLYISFENRISFGALTFFPQIALDYLQKPGFFEADPRGVISYTFPTETTISAASGKYHEFSQINPHSFQASPSRAADGTEIAPEHSVHNTLSVQQPLSGRFAFTIEGYYNHSYDLLTGDGYYQAGRYIWARNTGKMNTYGCEILLERNFKKSRLDYFGSVGYTWARSKLKRDSASGWTDTPYEREHKFNLMSGLIFGNHTLCTSFRFVSVAPPSDFNLLNPYEERWTYSEVDNAKLDKFYHRVDLRYSYMAGYRWGSIKYFVEILDCYAPFVKRKTGSDSSALPIMIPNLGLEMKF